VLLVEHVQNLFHRRLKQTHSSMYLSSHLIGINIFATDLEDTFQGYSSFTTNYLPAQDYEKLLVSASKMRAQSVRNWERREALESRLVRHQPSTLNH
jgi:hypothetical protein